ncbi:MAG: creatininase family protein [Anaerolineales bacterium]|jgi:creatinine amidohydrolase/Fe(II)-dependent formamide hydrolase-like protein
MTNLKWRELSTADFKDLSKERMIVILPLGSTEQHGPHMPVATDALMIEAVVNDVMEQLDGVESIFLPTLWCTKSGEHKDFPGTVFLSAETLMHVLEEISASVARAGFKKLVFLNAHGGNSDLLAVAARDIHQKTGLVTFVVDIMRLLAAYPPEDLEPGAFDIHAGQFETSVIMARHPKLMERRNWKGYGSDLKRGKVAATFEGFKYLRPQGNPVTVGWVTTDFTTDGVIGDPSNADAQKGKRGLQAQVQLVCDVLREIDAFEYKS